MEVFLLEVENPGCFWVTMKGSAPYIADDTEYENLNAKMSQFYDKSDKDVDELKLLMAGASQVYVVFSEELKCWCRAVIKSMMYCTDHYQIQCFLVDYAKYIFVDSKDVRVALEAFTQIPYRAKKCRLYLTRPVTLRIDFYEDTVKIVPAKKWDTAATRYFQNLLKATQMEARLCALEDDTFDVFLYVTIKDVKVCVNDELVLKKFAHFEEAEENTASSPGHQENQMSLNTKSHSVTVPNPALASRPVLLQEKESTRLETGLTVCSSFPKETNRRSSTDLKEKVVPMVNMAPGSPVRKDAQVHMDRPQQFFNSDPLKTHVIEDERQSFQNLSEERNVVFLTNKIEPSSSLETAPLYDCLKKELTRKMFLGPSFTQSYCWPPIAQGCDVVTVSHQGNDPLLYIPPILTIVQLGSRYEALPKRNGPLVLIICPGWKKAQLVFELLKTFGRCSRQLHPMLIILGQDKGAGSRVKIQGCEVIVTTPYSFFRLFEHHGTLFCRLCHLVLDEVETLLSEATEQVFTILNCYKNAVTTEEREHSPQQIIAVGTCWNKHIARLIKQFMNDPYVVITAVEEASICGNVQQVVQHCRSSERTAVLVTTLHVTHSRCQKVLVFTDSVNEAEMVHEALESNSIFSLKIHTENKLNLKSVLEQWTEKCSAGTQVVLDDCMQPLEITDATCVVHFSLPSLRTFGQRLSSMSDNFSNVIKDSSVDQEYTQTRSVLLLTDSSACRALEILHYLQHVEAEIPPELHDITAQALEAEEDRKFSRPLCACLKMFGICKNRMTCPDRHQINVQMDAPQNVPDKMLQAPGCVTIVPLHIVNATSYFGRIVDEEKDQYGILSEEINKYFKEPGNKISVKNVEKLMVYGLCEKTLFHRVQVVEVPPKEEDKVFSIKIKYIDEGRISQAQNDQLLHLPARFQCLPPQAVEFIVCRVKPLDNETEWNPQVTDYVRHKIKGKLHKAKIVHSLGNTAWVDPMVRVTRLSGLNVSINEYNVRSEILSAGLGTDNPEHIPRLQALCRHLKVVDDAENMELLSTEENTAGPENESSPENLSVQENPIENCSSSEIPSGNEQCGGVAQSEEAEDSTRDQQKCFYPEVKWFENEETVTVRVKITNAADCKCEFAKEKVLFSAYSGDKLYLANLELHRSVLAEESMYVIKDKEVVIVLAKEEKGEWCKLLKNKNPHVAFDFEHWEGLEDEGPFPVGTKKLHCASAVTEDLADSSEDSGTESDEEFGDGSFSSDKNHASKHGLLHEYFHSVDKTKHSLQNSP